MGAFKPHVSKNDAGDKIQAFWKNSDGYYAKRINAYLTLIIDLRTNEVVGVDIKQIKKIAESDYGNFE